MSLIIDQDRE